jgi:hypothetical protein
MPGRGGWEERRLASASIPPRRCHSATKQLMWACDCASPTSPVSTPPPIAARALNETCTWVSELRSLVGAPTFGAARNA